MRALATWGRGAAAAATIPEGWEDEANAHLEQLDLARRAFARSASSITAQRMLLGARDELKMAEVRLRLRAPDEFAHPGRPDPVPAHLRGSILYEAEAAALRSELADAAGERSAALRQARAQLRWLCRLGSSCGDAADPCPVCRDPLAEADTAVLPCGHVFCQPCVLRLARRSAATMPACPICRAPFPLSHVSLVRPLTDAAAGETEPGGPDAATRAASAALAAALAHPESGEAALHDAVGGWGTKVDAVARRLLWLSRRDASSKAIVFSEWPEVLRVLKAALDANQLPCLVGSGGGGGALAATLAAFRRPDGPARIILLPIARGGNGLTLTEAQHVLLVEPQLDLGAELQAVKRVDRIGQTLPTCVHRFYIRGSVEENVRAMSSRPRSASAAGHGPPGLRPSCVAALLREGGGMRADELRLEDELMP
jgi:E3 ubiquitin-protein ligase SHPRH